MTDVSTYQRRRSLALDGVVTGSHPLVRQAGRSFDRGPSRRAFGALVLGGVGTVLAGCGDDSSDAASTPTVSLTIPSQSLNFSQEVAEGFEFGVGTVNGVAAQVGGPSFIDGAGQLRVFQDFMARPSAGASLFTTNPEMFAGVLAEAARKGIPLIAVDNPPTSDAHVGLFIGNDNLELGRRLADQIIAELPPGTSAGTVVIGTTSPGAFVLEQRAAGMKAEFRERIPGLTVLGPYDTGRALDANRGAWGALIKANPDALAFAGTGDPDALSLAALHAQTKGDWAAGAFDLEPQALLAVKRGDLVVVSPEHYLKGVLAGRLLAERARNGTALPAGWIRTPGLGVTRANIDEIIARQSSPSAKQQWFREQTDRLLANPSPEQMPIP